MGNVQRALSAVGGTIREYGDMELRAQIEERHARRLMEVKNKYASEARTANEKFQLQRDTQAQKERFRVSEYEIGEREKAATVAHERSAGEAALGRASREKIAGMSASAGGTQSARMSLTNQIWENLKAIRPDEDSNELWLESFKLSNEKTELSPEADMRAMWKEAYQAAINDEWDPKTDKEARAIADEAETAYQEKMYPDFSAQRKRFKKRTSVGEDPVEKGGTLGVTEAPTTPQTKRDRLRTLY